MRNATIAGATVTMLLFTTASPHAQRQLNGVAGEIAQLLEVHRSGYVKGDATAWAAMYAEDAVFVGAAGGQRNLEGREAIRQFYAQLMADFPSRTADASNVRIRIYNEQATPTVVVTAEVRGTRTDASGREVGGSNRETLVWIKIHGKWLIISHHNSPLTANNSPK